ncbi:MAG: D-threitol dehydrogenase [Candidatus Altiarchaeales archaeon WOR_SM1_79]|nr:MAG: D-threitol dehydrogenase [Candidatus Altiarchaeales archaeon WOR_SM1_79]
MRFPNFALNDQVAIVTGGNKGIGQTIALCMAQAGADVVVTGRTKQELKDACTEIKRLGNKALWVEMDVRNVIDVERMVAQVLEAFGRIDVLVNNAGISHVLPAENHTEEIWDAIIDTNLKGVFLCSQAVGRQMIMQKRGSIVNMSSQAGTVGLLNHVAYCASKGGVNLLTKVLALEWAPHNVRVNAVSPTVIRTPMTDKVFADKDVRAEMTAKIPLGRFGEPEDVAGAVIFLASEASAMVTGHVLLVDGGWTSR